MWGALLLEPHASTLLRARLVTLPTTTRPSGHAPNARPSGSVNARPSAPFAIRTLVNRESSAAKATDVAADGKFRARSGDDKAGDSDLSSRSVTYDSVNGDPRARLRASGPDNARVRADLRTVRDVNGQNRTPLLTDGLGEAKTLPNLR